MNLSRDSYYFAILRIFSNQLSRSDCFAIPRQMRITKITTIQIKRRAARLTIPMTSSIASMATAIKNGGELINSGIIDSLMRKGEVPSPNGLGDPTPTKTRFLFALSFDLNLLFITLGTYAARSVSPPDKGDLGG